MRITLATGQPFLARKTLAFGGYQAALPHQQLAYHAVIESAAHFAPECFRQHIKLGMRARHNLFASPVRHRVRVVFAVSGTVDRAGRMSFGVACRSEPVCEPRLAVRLEEPPHLCQHVQLFQIARAAALCQPCLVAGNGGLHCLTSFPAGYLPLAGQLARRADQGEAQGGAVYLPARIGFNIAVREFRLCFFNPRCQLIVMLYQLFNEGLRRRAVVFACRFGQCFLECRAVRVLVQLLKHAMPCARIGGYIQQANFLPGFRFLSSLRHVFG